jgi:hypothetical protein
MNVYGMRLRPRLDPETGIEVVPKTPAGLIRHWKHVDRSRQGQPDAMRLAFAVGHPEVPTRTAEKHYSLMGHAGAPPGVPLAVDPRRDTWSAPDWIEFLDLVVAVNADTGVCERVQSFRPRNEDWLPEIVVQ